MLPIYKLVFDACDAEGGLQAISLVADPAMEAAMVTFSEEAAEVAQVVFAIDHDRMRMKGVVAIPGKMIPRKNVAGRFGPGIVTIDATDIALMSDDFFRKGRQRNITSKHKDPISFGTVVESIVVTPELQQGFQEMLGQEVPVGSLVQTLQFDETPEARAYWDSEVKTGNVTGYSLEAFLKHVPAKIQQTNMSKEKNEGFIARMKRAFGIVRFEKIALERQFLGDEQNTPIDVTDGVARYVDENGEPADFLPAGIYQMADGSEIEVGEAGVIKVTEAVAEEPVVAMEAERVAFEAERTAFAAERVELQSQLTALETRLKETSASLKTAESRIVELEKEPIGKKADVALSSEKKAANPASKNAYDRMFGR